MRIKNLVLLIGFVFVFNVLSQNIFAGNWADASATVSAGTRNYRVWIPDGFRAGDSLPMILMLHGCTQNPNDFAAGTQMNAFADQYKFFAVYPEQPSSANGSNCWNWFEPASQTRNSGEPSILAKIVTDVQANYSIRRDKTFVAGMSAGAAMTVVMGASYPDLFAAIGVCAGLEFRAGTDVSSGLLAQQVGGPDPNTQGQLAFTEMSVRRHRMPTIVFHGTLDVTVQPVNGTQVVQQWAQTNDFIDDGVDNNSVDATADQTIPGMVPNGRSYTRSIYNDASGNALIEFWSVEQMRHAWSGGSSAGSYTDPTGPNASREIVRFFNLDLVPTAAGISIHGQVLTAKSRALGGVRLTITGGNLPAPLTARTNSFGYYRFENLLAGETYFITASAKGVRFEQSTQVVTPTEDLRDINFVADQ